MTRPIDRLNASIAAIGLPLLIATGQFQPTVEGEVSMRHITTHQATPEDTRIHIEVADAPGPGGANHLYEIIVDGDAYSWRTPIRFQKGAIADNGPNGITIECLLAVAIDRLRGFQGGKFGCRENAIALTNIETALLWLHQRTRARQSRGVEGTMQL